MDNTLRFNPYQLPSGSNNPKAFSQDFFNTAQNTLGAERQNQANTLQGFMQSHNLGTGGSVPDLLTQVNGSPQQQIDQQILPSAMDASAVGAGQQFQTQMQQIQFQQQLEQLQEQYGEQRKLYELYSQLMPRGLVPSFGQTIGTGFSQGLGKAAAPLAAQALGGLL